MSGSDIQPSPASPAKSDHSSGQGKANVVDNIWKACAYGDFDKLRAIAAQDPALVNQPDEQGYYPLQWAALNNRVGVTNFLLENSAKPDTKDHTGQTALHWAAVRGSLQAAETLLRVGADPRLPDGKGYTICHVAAQYGQTAFLYHVALRWGADVDSADSDGRTPLHWAAYKGFTDTIRLLLVMDARFHLADKEGCTPLHWAAIRGNGEACTLLLQGGSASLLTALDVTGSTPSQLAIEKKHRHLGVHLAEWRQSQEGGKWFGKKGRLAFLTSTQLCPGIWALIIGLVSLFLFKVVHNTSIGPMSAINTLWSWSVVILAAAGLTVLYSITTADPGYVRSITKGNMRSTKGIANRGNGGNGGEGYNHYKALDSPALWAGNWNQLCVTCKIVRPLRAKHCSMTDRCVEEFDHYCPWVGNCVGKGNRHLFLIFLWLELFAMLISAVVTCFRLHQAYKLDSWVEVSGIPWMIMFVILDGFVLMSVGALAITQGSQIARNITTNELANWHRYKYLKDSEGQFSNPFDKGCKTNCTDALFPARTPSAPFVIPHDQPETMSLLKMEQGQLANKHLE